MKAHERTLVGKLARNNNDDNNNKKNDLYSDLARELKKLRNMKVTIVPIVTGACGPITK